MTPRTGHTPHHFIGDLEVMALATHLVAHTALAL